MGRTSFPSEKQSSVRAAYFPPASDRLIKTHSTLPTTAFVVALQQQTREARRTAQNRARGKGITMSTTKAKLLERLPGFENQLSSEGKQALCHALGNCDSFVVVRSKDAVSATLKKGFEESGVHCVALNDTDAATFFGEWTKSPLHGLKSEDVVLYPMLIVHEG
jgi:hypothetical protein